jgi:starch-binding outer membrane protein, SusD/RagB family
MKPITLISFIFIINILIINSCTKDLNVTPIDGNIIVSSNLTEKPGALVQTLAKLYASFSVPGQEGTSSKNGDISGIDNGFGVYSRALWMAQELTTDEALCSWNDQTIKDFHWQVWTPSDVFLNAMYARIIYTVSICNEFVRNTAGNNDPTTVKYNAEARFLRALAYYHAIDMFGNPAFITEADKPGSFFPKQISRDSLFNYVERELKAIEPLLGDPGPDPANYGHANRAADWMLLARLYLNAQVYTGTARWADCITYSEKVMAPSAGYVLEPDYRVNFCADNNISREMIFAIECDGWYTQSYGGTTYIIQAGTGDGMNGALQGVAGWSGNRATKDFVNVLIDTLSWAGVYPEPYRPLGYYLDKPGAHYKDSTFSKVPDKRVMLTQLINWNIYNVGTFTDGIGVRKFTNLNHDGSPAIHPHTDFTSTDFPIFRLAEAYLMHAEAILRSNGDRSKALTDINTIRARAYGNNNGNINDAKLTLDYILDERGRELYWEAVRRTDLIRYDKFVTNKYLWAWKGNTFAGRATESYRNLFPIPSNEVGANPNIKQNTGY